MHKVLDLSPTNISSKEGQGKQRSSPNTSTVTGFGIFFFLAFFSDVFIVLYLFFFLAVGVDFPLHFPSNQMVLQSQSIQARVGLNGFLHFRFCANHI